MKNDFKELYLKNRYDKYNNIFNIWSLFFGAFYLLYKKMYVFGIIILILDFLSYLFNSCYLVIIINIILSIIFNRIYIKFVEHKIESYKLKYMDNKLVERECSKNNNDIVIVVLFVLIAILGFFISNIRFDEKNIRIGDIGFRLESNWEKGKYNNKYYSVYSYESKCSITVERIGFYNDSDYLKDIINNYDSDYDINDININDIEYKMVNIGNNYIYTTYIDNELYVLLFDIYDDYELCSKYKKNIFDSVIVYK